MTTRTITQREARALKKRVEQFEEAEQHRRNRWACSYPGGTHIGSINVADVTHAKVRTARLMKHAIVAVENDSGQLHLYALPVAKDTNA